MNLPRPYEARRQFGGVTSGARAASFSGFNLGLGLVSAFPVAYFLYTLPNTYNTNTRRPFHDQTSDRAIMALPPGLFHQSGDSDRVTVDRDYLDALVRR